MYASMINQLMGFCCGLITHWTHLMVW